VILLISDTGRVIIVTEYCRPELVEKKFTEEERLIVDTDFKNKLEIVPRFDGQHEIKTQQYVGYIILPDHQIYIKPKIPNLSFINMVKYALDLPDIRPEYFSAKEEQNYIDILVLFLLDEVEVLIQKGLYMNYINYDDNLNCVRGKILFKENLIHNHDRIDKIFCSFSELTQDIIENQIIKYTLYHLSMVQFIDNSINTRLVEYYKKLDQIELVNISASSFNSIHFTPLNEQYKPIISLCELLLRDSSLGTIGDITSLSFLINMDLLFQEFVGNLLRKELGESNVSLQKTESIDIHESLELVLDIKILYNNISTLILDTKYEQHPGKKPRPEHVHQMVSYSVGTGIKQCGLVYVGNIPTRTDHLKQAINLFTLSLNISVSTKQQFEENCSLFIKEIKALSEQ
jgi:5-methylcytosine-specific restriction enzyme subunit McrC